MMESTAKKRSIDEIIGSIRSIVNDRPYDVANDDVSFPIDLSDLPTGSNRALRAAPPEPDVLAEPIARPFGAAEPFPAQSAELHDVPSWTAPDANKEAEAADQMAEIAATVEHNIAALGREGVRRDEPADALREEREIDDASAADEIERSGERSASAKIDPFEKFNALRATIEAAPPLRAPAPRPVPPVQAVAIAPAPAPIPEPAASDPVLDEEMMRPIIREWLDDNLPPLVERLVREELSRAINGGPSPR